MIDNNKILPVLRLGTKIYFVNAEVSELPLQDKRLGCVVNLYDGVVQDMYVEIQSLVHFNPYWEEVPLNEDSFEEIRDLLKRYLSDEQMIKFYSYFESLQNGEFLRDKESVLRPEVMYMDESMYPNANCSKCKLYSEGICSKLGEVNPGGWCKMWINIIP